MASLDKIAKIMSVISDEPLINIQQEKQNQAYEGATFSINQITFRSRVAKLTPKKQGYFVAFWEKKGKNQAYSLENAPDKWIVSIFDQEKVGQFIFPKTLLAKQKILKDEHHIGKMALRVYPSWSNHLNKTAMLTQKWQAPFFIDLSHKVDTERLWTLYFG